MKNLEGNYIWVKLNFCRAETNNIEDFRFVFMVQDVHEESLILLSTLKKNEELASRDSLTNVYNHARIETELINAIENKKETQQAVSIIMIDLDHFKTINDRFGHAVGDTTIKNFATMICDLLNAYHIQVGRWGEDEFVAVCYDLGASELMRIAEEMRAQIAGAEFETVGNITCSVGITEIYEDDIAKNAFERADKAMYVAKARGRNCVEVEL